MPVTTKQHEYTTSIVWTGDRGSGNRGLRDYDRTWDVVVPGKPVLACSNDPILGGDASRYNPEDLLLSSLSACHMLWYLHLASSAGVTVHGYRDEPVAVGETAPSGAGRFLRAELRPIIELDSEADRDRADALHAEVDRFCFIARSVAFPVSCVAQYVLREPAP